MAPFNNTKSIARFLQSYKKLLNYYNFVEYIFPAALFLLLIYGDIFFILEKKIKILPENPSINSYVNFLIPAFLLLTAGWFMYASRFYQLFPGYKKIKKTFRERLSETFLEQFEVPDNQRELLGKYIFKKYWEIATKKEKDAQLKLHVNWVFLVHLCNSIMLSLFLCFILYFFKYTKTEFSFNIEILYLPIIHVLVYFYFRRAALKNMVKANFEIIDLVNKKRAKFAKNIPPNITEILDAID